MKATQTTTKSTTVTTGKAAAPSVGVFPLQQPAGLQSTQPMMQQQSMPSQGPMIIDARNTTAHAGNNDHRATVHKKHHHGNPDTVEVHTHSDRRDNVEVLNGAAGDKTVIIDKTQGLNRGHGAVHEKTTVVPTSGVKDEVVVLK